MSELPVLGCLLSNKDETISSRGSQPQCLNLTVFTVAVAVLKLIICMYFICI